MRKTELEALDRKYDQGIMEIKQLQQQLEDYQNKLIYLVPEKQLLSERIKSAQLDNTQSTGVNSVHKTSQEKEELCQRLKEQLDALEKETASKLAEMDEFNSQLKDLRESYSTQQLALEQLHRIKQDKIREVQKRRAELAQKKRLEDEAARKAKREKENRWQENIRREEEEKKKRLEEERMQEKVQEKLKAEEAAAMMRERENKQQLLAEEEKNRQAMREVEQQRQRQLEEDKRKQEQIAKEAEERRKQNEEIKKIKETTNSQAVEKHTSKININEKFADLLKPTEGKSLKPPWKNEGNAAGAAESRNSIALVNYRALYPFEARNHDEMSFNTGDVIQVDEKTVGEPGWLYGSFQGHFGWFPCNYVEKIPEGEKALSPKKALLPPTVSLSTTSAASEPLSPSKSAEESDYQKDRKSVV